jgi:hypothetical protein
MLYKIDNIVFHITPKNPEKVEYRVPCFDELKDSTNCIFDDAVLLENGIFIDCTRKKPKVVEIKE